MTIRTFLAVLALCALLGATWVLVPVAPRDDEHARFVRDVQVTRNSLRQ